MLASYMSLFSFKRVGVGAGSPQSSLVMLFAGGDLFDLIGLNP